MAAGDDGLNRFTEAVISFNEAVTELAKIPGFIDVTIKDDLDPDDLSIHYRYEGHARVCGRLGSLRSMARVAKTMELWLAVMGITEPKPEDPVMIMYTRDQLTKWSAWMRRNVLAEVKEQLYLNSGTTADALEIVQNLMMKADQPHGETRDDKTG